MAMLSVVLQRRNFPNNLLELSYSNHLKNDRISEKFFRDVLRRAISVACLPNRSVGLSLNLIGEAKIRELNRDYRGKDKATDVLSFPLGLIKGKKLITGAKSGRNDILELGDIFICLPVVKKAATREGKGLKPLLKLMAVHGFLHLIGYDHDNSSKERKMLTLQHKILQIS